MTYIVVSICLLLFVFNCDAFLLAKTSVKGLHLVNRNAVNIRSINRFGIEKQLFMSSEAEEESTYAYYEYCEYMFLTYSHFRRVRSCCGISRDIRKN